jgi:hypothetical protein
VAVTVSVSIGVKLSRSIKTETAHAVEKDSQRADGLDDSLPYCVYREEASCLDYKVSQIELAIP